MNRPKDHACAAINAARLGAAAVLLALLAGCNSSDSPTESASVSSADLTASTANASRLLDQATFGVTSRDLADVQAMGIEKWVDNQLAMPETPYRSVPFASVYTPTACNSTADACNRDKFTAFLPQINFYQNALTAPDQLRQRVALALSQIFIANVAQSGYGTQTYQQLILDGAFGNYRDLLENVTLNPAMGEFLDMINNTAPSPNQNYGREVLQVFSIGPTLLNLDGSNVLDAKGLPVPAYNQPVVEGFSAVFTGWTAPRGNSVGYICYFCSGYYYGQMQLYESFHDTGAKLLLNNQTLPANQLATTDLKAALDNIFNHPNVGPFIGKALIKFLVTSNPSPGYVARIATVFNDNGQQVRGDLKAVVRAILLDAEARGDEPSSASFGRLRDPVLYMTGLIRALNGRSDGVWLQSVASRAGLDLFNAHSVFSYYSPSYPLPKAAGYVAPEFQLQDTKSILDRLNFLTALVDAPNGVAALPDATVANAIGTQVDLSGLQSRAGDPGLLIDTLSAMLLHGKLTAQEKAIYVNALNTIPATDLSGRARTAVYLVASSPRYQIIR